MSRPSTISWPPRRCPICGGLSGERLPGRADLVECQSCHVIWNLFAASRNPDSRVSSDWNTVEALWQVAWIAALEPQAKTVLDVSPASSQFTDMLSLNGWKVSTCQLSNDGAVQEDRSKRFHVVTAWDLLGRVEDPVGFVRDAIDHLVPGGCLVFSVPGHPDVWDGSPHDRDTTDLLVFADASDLSQLLSLATKLPKVVFDAGAHTSDPLVLAVVRHADRLGQHDDELARTLARHADGIRGDPLHPVIAARFGHPDDSEGDRDLSELPPALYEAAITFYVNGAADAARRLGDAPALAPDWDRIARRHLSALAGIAITEAATGNSLGMVAERGHAAPSQALSAEAQLEEIRSSLLWMVLAPIAWRVRRLLPRFVVTRLFPMLKRWGREEGGHRLRVLWAHLSARIGRRVRLVGRRLVPAPMWLRLRNWTEPRLPLVIQAPWPGSVPLVSVIIPCYNYGQYLLDAVESVDRQSLSNIEIIIVDDGSTDGPTLTQIEQLADARPDLTIIRQENRGLPAARNCGIGVARGRYICCLDADDRLDPTYLEKTAAILESRPDMALAYSWARLFEDEDGVWQTEPFNPQKLLTYNFLPVAALFRRDAWVAVGGYDESLRIGYEDWDFWLRLAGAGINGFLIPEPLFWHRRHGRTMTHRARSQHARLASTLRSRHSDAIARRPRSTWVEVEPAQAFVHLKSREKRSGRLLCLLPWVQVGGAEAVVLDALRTLQQDGNWEVSVATTEPSENKFLKQFRLLTPYVYVLPDMLPQHLFGPFLTAFLARNATDVVLISHSTLAYGHVQEWKTHFPATCIIDILHNDLAAGFSTMSTSGDAWIDGHIAVHQGIQENLGRLGIPTAKVHVIRNGVSAETFYPEPARGLAWLRRERLSDSRPHIAFVGRLSPEKHPELFVRASASLRSLGAEWLLAGDGPLRQAVIDLWRSLNRPCVLLGERNDVADLLRASDLLVLTSKGEGLPLVVLEALLTGVPVVAPDLPGLSTIIDQGVTGYLVPRDRDNDLVTTVQNLLRDPASLTALKRSCLAAVSHNRSRFSSEAMGQGYVQVIRDILTHSRAAALDSLRA